MPRRAFLLAIAICAFAVAPSAHAQESVVTLDPATTKIDFTLSATLHTVHGTFKLKSGSIRFDLRTGKASGAVIVDATTGNTDNSGRDSKMHKEILESAKFPDIVFTPTGAKGSIAHGENSQIEVSGTIRLHGQDHPVTLPMSVRIAGKESGQLEATAKFAVPYIQWGLKNPSNFFLHVSDTVNVEIHARGHITATNQPDTPQR